MTNHLFDHLDRCQLRYAFQVIVGSWSQVLEWVAQEIKKWFQVLVQALNEGKAYLVASPRLQLSYITCI